MRAILFFLLMALPAAISAQTVSLNDQEVAKLKKLMATNQQAASVFKEWLDLANQSLKEKPNPIDTIVSEGHLISHPKKQLTLKSFPDIRKTYALAIAYAINGKKMYLQKCVEFLTAWAQINQPTGNPINDTKLELMIEAYDLIKKDIAETDRKLIMKWFDKLAAEEIRTFKDNYNNWNSHRLKIIAAIAFTINSESYINYVKEQITVQITNNLYADGSGLDFKHRDALHYHTYTLEPLLKTALILNRAAGDNYFDYVSSSGSSIKQSVDFLAVYAKGEKKHPEFVNSKVKIDRDRAAQNEPGFAIGSYFEVVKAIDVFAYASYFESKYAPVYELLAKEKPLSENGPVIIDTKPYSKWIPILNQVR